MPRKTHPHAEPVEARPIVVQPIHRPQAGDRNAANPFARAHSGFPSQKGKTDLLKIEKGAELKLKYAIYAHTGDARSGKVADAYEVFKK